MGTSVEYPSSAAVVSVGPPIRSWIQAKQLIAVSATAMAARTKLWPRRRARMIPDPTLGRARQRFIQQEPVHPQRPGGFRELLEVHRLDDVAVDAQAIALHQVAFLARRGEHDHRGCPGAGVALDPTQDLQAVDQRQFDVQQDDLRQIGDVEDSILPRTEDELERLGSVADDVN